MIFLLREVIDLWQLFHKLGSKECLMLIPRVGEETDLPGEHVPLLHVLHIQQERGPGKYSVSQWVLSLLIIFLFPNYRNEKEQESC